MSDFPKTDRNKVKRIPKRGHYDRETIHAILDAGFLCHVGFSVDGQPFVIPTSYGRDGDVIYLHGSSKSRMMNSLDGGLPVCLTVTHLDGLVLARSAFHHSMNYRSAVIFGKATEVHGEEKGRALFLISENILPGRWDEVRGPNATEMKATSVLRLDVESASAKIRTGPPGDEAEDYALPVWAGVVPMSVQHGEPVADPVLAEGIPLPGSVAGILNSSEDEKKITINFYREMSPPTSIMKKRRPTTAEYGQFYHGYITHVEGDDIVAILEKNKATVSDFFKKLPAEKWDHAYAPGKWTVKELLLHLIDGERVFSYRALRIGRGDVTPLPGFDENVFAENSNAEGRTPASLIAEYEAVRESTLHLFRHLGDEAGDCIGTASGFPVSPLAIGFIIAGHELHHLRIIRERYL